MHKKSFVPYNLIVTDINFIRSHQFVPWWPHAGRSARRPGWRPAAERTAARWPSWPGQHTMLNLTRFCGQNY